MKAGESPIRGFIRAMLVNRYIDARYTAVGLAVAVGLAAVIAASTPRISFWPSLLAVLVGWLVVGLSTLADE